MSGTALSAHSLAQETKPGGRAKLYYFFVLIRLTPNGRHEPGSPLQDAEHPARSTEMDLIHDPFQLATAAIRGTDHGNSVLRVPSIIRRRLSRRSRTHRASAVNSLGVNRISMVRSNQAVDWLAENVNSRTPTSTSRRRGVARTWRPSRAPTARGPDRLWLRSRRRTRGRAS